MGIASLGDKDMEMGMKVDAVTKGLDDDNDSRHQFLTCDSGEVFD